MMMEIGLIAAGIPAGWLLRKQARAQAVVGHVLTWTVRLLLFLLGLSIGADATLLGTMEILGVRAACISVLAIAGSLVVARLLGSRLNRASDSSPTGELP